MTGNVPYYGGRFTPRQAYAAAHPGPPPPPPSPPPAPSRTPRPSRTRPDATRTDPMLALQELLDSGVITTDEFEELRSRVER